jgi:hypothetical protein
MRLDPLKSNGNYIYSLSTYDAVYSDIKVLKFAAFIFWVQDFYTLKMEVEIFYGTVIYIFI